MAKFNTSIVKQMLEMHQYCTDYRRDLGELNEMGAYLVRKVEKLNKFPGCTEVVAEICHVCEQVKCVTTTEWSSHIENERQNNRIEIERLGELNYSSDIHNPQVNVSCS